MELDDSTWQLEQHELARCLIGFVTDVRRFGSYLMQMHVNELWHLEGSVHVYGRSKNHFVFLFEQVGDMHRSVDNGPYAIQGALLIIDYWKPDLILDRLLFDKMMVWVQLYGLPLECFTEEAGVHLGRAVGDVVKVDIDSLMPRNIRFLRLRVWVPLDKPLISGFFLKFRDGQQHWISCRYERVCKISRNCGRIGHTLTNCATSFDEAQRQIDDHLQDMGRRLHSRVMTQESHPMYSASIQANAHRADRHTTRIFQNSTHTHMEIPEEVAPSANGHDTNLDADFADMWERDWDTGLQHGTPAGSESPLPVVQRDGGSPSTSSPDIRLGASDVLSGLGQAPVDSVGELEVMWHQWEGQLSSMGIRPGQLVTERVGELTAFLCQEQLNYSGSINGPDQGPLLASTDEVLRAICLNGPSPRLNLPMGEAPITTQAFIQASPSHCVHLGSVTFEVGQSSSIMDTGPQTAPVVAAPSYLTPPISTSSRPSIRKRLQEMDLGFELFYDTEPMFPMDTVRGSLHDGNNELVMHSSGIVSDSMCPSSSIGSLVRKHFRRRKQARYSTLSVLHDHADLWLPREKSDRSLAKRRRRKLRRRSTPLRVAVGSATGFIS
ncbi:hypothetical protein LOK49_LG06G02419 [Camellia lanceoleosa]|uniref:Uncharacterized protein n=1 Tax=Camellia lanceoleosa TaxID=1840588 RepID=A0ACC0HH87_9ERIC|nr:hypothetical protein LOK49_LG06G02419 [Camellia lanceoleosa]